MLEAKWLRIANHYSPRSFELPHFENNQQAVKSLVVQGLLLEKDDVYRVTPLGALIARAGG